VQSEDIKRRSCRLSEVAVLRDFRSGRTLFKPRARTEGSRERFISRTTLKVAKKRVRVEDSLEMPVYFEIEEALIELAENRL
jgi:hypothetical protein